MNKTPPPLPLRIDRKPILFSALLYPGAGQYMVGRKVAAVAYAACFTVALAVFLAFFFRYFSEVWEMLKTWWSSPDLAVDATPSARHLLQPGLYLLVVYLANLYDVTWHLYRPHLENRAKAGNKTK